MWLFSSCWIVAHRATVLMLQAFYGDHIQQSEFQPRSMRRFIHSEAATQAETRGTPWLSSSSLPTCPPLSSLLLTSTSSQLITPLPPHIVNPGGHYCHSDSPCPFILTSPLPSFLSSLFLPSSTSMKHPCNCCCYIIIHCPSLIFAVIAPPVGEQLKMRANDDTV